MRFEKYNLPGWALCYLINGDAGEESAEEAEARGPLAEALEAAGATLDEICAYLCDQPLRCAGVFSNGEAIYQRA